MYKEKLVCVVIPAYNEEVQIVKILETMPPLVDRIVVVDDASTDNTATVVASFQAKDARILLFRHDVNRGVGASRATGLKWARDNGMEIAVTMDGDGQHDCADIVLLLDPVAAGEVDFCKENRLFSGKAFQNIPKVRFFGNSILTLLTKIASGYWHVTDSQTGFTAINRRGLDLIDWDAMYPRYGQPNDLLVRLNVFDLKVRDIPTEPHYHVGERSKLKVGRVVFPIAGLLMRMFLWRLKEKYILRDFHPLVFFYALAALTFVLVIVFLVRVILYWLHSGHLPEVTLLILLFLSITSFQSLFFAMWMDMERNSHLK